jgi:hypothetical protein
MQEGIMHTFLPLFTRDLKPFPSCAFPGFNSYDLKTTRPKFWVRFRNWMSSINSLAHQAPPNFASEATSTASAESENGDAEAIEILAVSAGAWGRPVYDALRSNRSLRLCSTDDPRTLWLIPMQQIIHVIVLNCSLSAHELEEVGRLARHRWPEARILVIRSGDDFMEDALYDDRIYPTADPGVLISSIERLVANGAKGGALNAGR